MILFVLSDYGKPIICINTSQTALKTIAYYSDTAALDDPALYYSLYETMPDYRRRKIDKFLFMKDKQLSMGVELLLRHALEELDEVIESNAPNVEEIIIDMKDVPYIASAGLRSILNADELMEDRKGVKLTNVNNDVMSILKMSGFLDALNII